MGYKKYSVVGHPIGHTMSPFIHERLFQISGVDAEYTKFDIAPQKLQEEFIQALITERIIQVTITQNATLLVQPLFICIME